LLEADSKTDMPHLLLLLVGIVALPAECSSRGLPDSRTVGLKFGLAIEDHVLFKPAMEPLQDSFTVCAWVKKLRSGDYPAFFAYGTSSRSNELLMLDNAYDFIFDILVDRRNKTATTALGAWRHHCVSWSVASKTFRVYYDGELIGAQVTAADLKLGLDGYMALGNEFDSYGGGFVEINSFGGELFKVNVFIRELTAEEIKRMFLEGMCSDIEESYGRTRYLKWSDFLLEERSGNVTEIDMGCRTEQSRWDVLYLESFYNKLLTRDLLQRLRSSWDMLEDFVGATVTDRFIRHFKFYHNDEKAHDLE